MSSIAAASGAQQPLAGRTVTVTGAARGIGRHIALAMAAAGADVVATARSMASARATIDEVRALGRRGLAVELDVRDPAAVQAAFDQIGAAMGPLDVLVCNSGVGGPTLPLWNVSDQDWDEVMDVNVTGAFRCVRAAIRHMPVSGSIVFIGSMTGKRPLLHRSPYAASKMALVGLCRTLALDAGERGLRVNLISPGFVEGDRLDWVIDSQAMARGLDAQTVRDEFAAASPLHRFTTANDVAAVAVFLASDAAAGVTGEDVNVSSGLVTY